MSLLTITFKNFQIERALSEGAIYKGETFKEFISDGDSFSAIKLAECLDPEFNMEQLDGDITWHFEEYYQNNPIASSITVSNIKENVEDEALCFEVNWIFEDFKAKDHDDFRDTLQSWRSDMKYACQCKRDILVNYCLRNNRHNKPIVIIKFE